MSPDLLERMRKFYRNYPQLWPAISATASRNSWSLPSSADVTTTSEISATASRRSSSQALQPLSAEAVFRLSWSHLVELLRLDDPWKRAFYENETLRASYSVRELQRQINSLLYERTGLSTDKNAVIAAARSDEALAKPLLAGLLRDPYVLEFTGLAERPQYRETDLESALLDHLQTPANLSARAREWLLL